MNEIAAAFEFIVTREHRRFVEFCDACRRYRYIGLCYGPPGVGKTVSARHFAQQDQVEHLLAHHRLLDLPIASAVLECMTLFYTPPVVNSPGRIEKDILAGRTQLREVHYWMQGAAQEKVAHSLPLDTPDVTELIVVDEADRLTASSLEEVRDIYDRSQLGVVLIGMPGIEKRLSRYPQLYSRVGFVHHFRPLSNDEVRSVLQNNWQQFGLSLDPGDATDTDAFAAITRITNGNFRLLQRLLSQVERVLKINELRYITKEVVETARELLIVGPT